MPHVSLKCILHDATRRHYGVPNLWGGNLEKVIGYIKAADKVKAPLIICYNKGLCPDIPIEINMPLLVKAAEYAKAPIATILDHGEDLDEVVSAISYGASSVMFDGSQLRYEENVSRTREIVDYAHARGVDVEAELGAVGGSAIESGGYSDIKSVFTDPEQALDFVKRTGVDALAISFGNAHGQYKGKPRLDIDRVKKVAAIVDIPLVMHGASGLKDSDYGNVIDAGISKINYYTTMGLSSAANLRRKAARAGDDLVCHKIVQWNIDFITKETEDLLVLLRGAGKAESTAQAAGDNTMDLVQVVSEAIVGVLKNTKQ
jgi:fructose-bisphosphate aldolase class II